MLLCADFVFVAQEVRNTPRNVFDGLPLGRRSNFGTPFAVTSRRDDAPAIFIVCHFPFFTTLLPLYRYKSSAEPLLVCAPCVPRRILSILSILSVHLRVHLPSFHFFLVLLFLCRLQASRCLLFALDSELSLLLFLLGYGFGYPAALLAFVLE